MPETYMVSVAENLNVSNRKVWAGFKDQEPRPIRDMVEKIAAAGPDRIDINLGPVRKNAAEMMPWAVKIVQEITDIPLALDAFQVEAIEAGLKVCRQPALINSIMIRPDRYEALLPLAKTYGADYVALMWGSDGLPRDVDERAALITELLTAAQGLGIPAARAWVDPVITPTSIQQNHLAEYGAFLEMLPDIVKAIEEGGTVKSICGLSNVSNGSLNHLRPILNQVYLCMLKRKGLHSCMVNALDPVIMDLCRGKLPWFAELVYGVMDGREYDLPSLKKEEADVVETARGILGQSLFHEIWLDLEAAI